VGEEHAVPNRNQEKWHTMLSYLASRDGSVELSRRVGGHDEATMVYRSRVFEVRDDGCIIVEVPSQATRDKAFRVGYDIDLTLAVKGVRMIATSTVREMMLHRVNPTLRVTCFRLSPGRRPAIEQRRAFFRASVAAMQLQPTILSCTIDEMPYSYSCKLANISAGGMGVSIRAARSVLNQLKRTRRFTCEAWLSEDESLVVPVAVAHIAALGDDGLYLGLKLDVDDEIERRAIEQRMQQRCTEVQRWQLQRRRA
jgi:c-di-GMP-binding flagellar brake protein YcgR